MSEWSGSLTGRSGGRSDGLSSSRCRRLVPERQSRADIEHSLDLALGHLECRGGVGHAVEPFTIGADPRMRARSQRRAPPGRALGGDEPLVGVRVASREDGSEVGALNNTDQPGACRGSAEPPARFLAAVGVVPLGPTPARRRSGTRSRGLGWRLEIAENRVDDAHRVGASTAERGDRELHRTRPTGGPAGSPKGNLQMCARRTCRFAAT